MDVSQTDLAWLAGIVDGEGNLYIGKKTAENGVEYLDMKVRISSTDMRMIRRISEIYHKMNLRFHFARVNFNRGTWKHAISINVGTHKSALKLLTAILPFLVNKKELSRIAIDILSYVTTFPKGGNTVRKNYWGTQEMEGMLGAYQVEKAWYFEPSTTSRKANAVFAFDDKV